MKQFLKTNWYKVMISISVFIFSVGFFINSITPAFARNPSDSIGVTKSEKKPNSDDYTVVASGGYAFLVGYSVYNSYRVEVKAKVQLK